MGEMLIKNASRNSHMPSRKKKTGSVGIRPSSGVFGSIDEIVASLERAKPAAEQVTKIGTKASHELQELEISVKRTSRKAATGIQLPVEKVKTSVREMREILSSVLRDWPELLTATEQLKPRLHQLTEQLDSVLQS